MTQQCRSASGERNRPITNGLSVTAMAAVPVVLALLVVVCKMLANYVGPNLPPHFVQLSGETGEPESDEIQAGLSQDLERTEEKFDHFYAIIIDAGSTGTRASVFQFKHDNSKFSSGFKLESESTKEVKPGLSTFSYDPKAGGASLIPLLTFAESLIPQPLRNNTPLALKATAGLRLLPAEIAESILDQVEAVIRRSPFLLNNNSVSLMSGVDEGTYGWFTLNFLLDRLSLDSTKSSGVYMDLGGGSTQIAFLPSSEESLNDSPEDFIRDVHVFGEVYKLYSYSYLGNGLLSARYSTLFSNSKEKASKYKLFTSCLPDFYSLKWNFSGSVYLVRGKADYNPDNCAKEIVKFVRLSRIHRPLDLESREIYVVAYFYDRALQSGIIDEDNFTSVSAFQQAAHNACSRTKFGSEHWDPWKCFDLTYIYHFLTDGYGLPPEKTIHITQKINGNEASWSLGAAFHLLHTYSNSSESTSLLAKGCPLLHSFCDSVFNSVAVLWNSLAALFHFPFAV